MQNKSKLFQHQNIDKMSVFLGYGHPHELSKLIPLNQRLENFVIYIDKISK